MKESHNSHTEPKTPDMEGCVLCDPIDVKVKNFCDASVRGWFPWGKIPTGKGHKGTFWVLRNELWLPGCWSRGCVHVSKFIKLYPWGTILCVSDV